MKLLKIFGAIFIVLGIVFMVDYYSASISTTYSGNITSNTDEYVFPHDKVVTVDIQIDEDVYDDMISNALDEEYVMADIVYNGIELKDVGIRPKGNSSLRDVAQSGDDRFSFKVDFDYYVDEQNLYGINKINLNNLFADSSMMAEYIAYEVLDSMDADAPRTTYTALMINGEYYGLYLAVEQVNESFLLDHFETATGDLFKPDMGTGSDLKYISDDSDDYPGMIPENNEKSEKYNLINLMKVISEDGDLSTVLDIDSFAKYLALSSAVVHLDAYQGGMFHNYYLYDNNSVFQWISWDLNMSFNGFPKGGTDEQMMSFLIDEPVSGSMSGYPLIEAFFQNEEYVEIYHSYLEELFDNYLSPETFQSRVLEIYELIKEYVKNDENSFYTYEQFEDALFTDSANMSLPTFVANRRENVLKQLSGEIPSTNNGNGNAASKGRQRNAGGPPADGNTGDAPAEKNNTAPAKDGDVAPTEDNKNPGTVNKNLDKNGDNKNKPALEETETPPDKAQKPEKGMLGEKPEKGMLGDKEANGDVPPNGMGGKRAGGMKSFNLTLPDGVNIEDIPEKYRVYFESDTPPTKEVMDEMMMELPEDIVTKLRESMGPPPNGEMDDRGKMGKNNSHTIEETADPEAVLLNLEILGVFVLGMLGMIYFLKKK